MSKFPSKILIIDHDQTVMNQIESMLDRRKIPVVKAPNWEQAIYHYNQNKIDLVMSEKNLEGLPGSVLIQKFRNHDVPSKRNPGMIITQATPVSSEDTNIMKELGEIVLVKKPIKEATLLSLIAKAMEEASQRASIHELKINVLDPLWERGETDKAVAVADQKLVNGGPKSRFLASEVFEHAEDYQRSLDITSKLLKDDPKNLSYINQLARLRMRTCNYEDAKKYYEMADKLAPDNLERLQRMADMYLEMRLPQKSIEKYRDLIKFNPEDPDLKFKFFQNLQDAGFEKEAQDFCEETTGAKELIRHFNNRGVMFAKEGNYLDAIDEYEKAKRLMPHARELYRILYNLAIAHINLKSKDHITKADKILHEVIQLKPDYDKAHDKLKLTQKYLNKSA
ncbi:response regulator [Pseudobacteriovorax antillogorgiicola]|uniref:Tetratricopeptide repeat-containing protein n=1 Tax=Pseudobacteriovorax antillogorgiicola TaxID=1513793 RepID=A0A1Y6CC88_9BACT|nr:response regulator [Pseudobacteriovorax antillogorgiicola]TCS48322.1 tetratricopeptide repeat protein [Pseudobacteriovorax antillogorgiicola]SMF56593.1 Tetratricopeptide repeat-containing protein [Pseudobacteriovorax antillogorgiicola]